MTHPCRLGDSFYEYLYKVWALEGKPAGSPARDRCGNCDMILTCAVL